MGRRLSALIGLVHLPVIVSLPPLFLDREFVPARTWSNLDQALVVLVDGGLFEVMIG